MEKGTVYKVTEDGGARARKTRCEASGCVVMIGGWPDSDKTKPTPVMLSESEDQERRAVVTDVDSLNRFWEVGPRNKLPREERGENDNIVIANLPDGSMMLVDRRDPYNAIPTDEAKLNAFRLDLPEALGSLAAPRELATMAL